MYAIFTMFGAVQENFQLLNGHCPKQLTPKKHLNGNGIVAHNNHQTTPSDTPNQKRCTAAPMKLFNCCCPAIVDLLCNLTSLAKVSRYRLDGSTKACHRQRELCCDVPFTRQHTCTVASLLMERFICMLEPASSHPAGRWELLSH